MGKFLMFKLVNSRYVKVFISYCANNSTQQYLSIDLERIFKHFNYTVFACRNKKYSRLTLLASFKKPTIL